MIYVLKMRISLFTFYGVFHNTVSFKGYKTEGFVNSGRLVDGAIHSLDLTKLGEIILKYY